MTYTTLTFNGTEKSLADWSLGNWRREVYNQASDSFAFDLIAPMDGPETFPYGSMITISRGRMPASGPSTTSSGLPISGCTGWTGGTKWFVGYRVKNVRVATPQLEKFQYKFAGPWDFFFERLVFQKLWLCWNGGTVGGNGKMIADYRSQVVLGLSPTWLSGPGDTVTGTTATVLMSIAQELIEIAQWVATQSGYEQTVNGLGWPAGPQIQSDSLTVDANGNYQLKTGAGARANITIPDFVPGYAGSNNDIQTTTTGIVLRAPLDTVNDMACAECFRRQLRWLGSLGTPVVWFDYSTSPPTLHVGTRDQLPAVSLPFVGSTEGINIERRDDLIPPCVAFRYRISGSISGAPYVIIMNDIAATVDGAAVEGVGMYVDIGVTPPMAAPNGAAISSDAQIQLPLAARRVGAQVATFDFEGASFQSAKGTIQTVPLNLADPAGGGAPLAAWASLFPDLANVGGLAFYHDPSGAVTPLMLDPSGTAINSTTYPALFAGGGPYVLTEGNVCPWMFVGNNSSNAPASCVQATITAYFTYIDNASAAADTAVNPGTVQCHPKTIKLKLTNLASGAYQSQAWLTSQADPVPYGLAGYIYAPATIPQYEGHITIVEQEISDVCPIGNLLNLSGARAEWAAMNAAVQSVSYDDNGKTEITFGPASHLGPSDMIELLRVNRGPRWFYQIGGDVLSQNNSSGALALGQNVPVSSPSAGNKVNSDLLIPQSLTDLQSHLSAYATALPGVYFWSKGNQRAGISALDAGPGILLGSGAGGTLDGQYVKISVAQLLSIVAGQPVKFYELNTCEDGDATYFRTFLCTDKYHHS